MSELTYTTSRDYERLWELLNNGMRVICWWDRRISGIVVDRPLGEIEAVLNRITIKSTDSKSCLEIPSSFPHLNQLSESINIKFLDPELPEQQAARIEELENGLQRALEAIEELGEILNGMDAVDEECENYVNPRIDTARKALEGQRS